MSLLDAKETEVRTPSGCSYQAFAAQSHIPEWKSARAAYALLEDTGDLSKLDAFSYCRKVAWFVRHDDTGQVRVASKQCHLRWCPTCAKARQNYIAHQVKEWLSTEKYAKFITLTLRSSDDSITDQINRIYDCFKRVRKSTTWKEHIKSGCWFFQITLNLETEQWHPHIHIIAEGKFFSMRKLSRLWEAVTGDSPIVDIRAVKDKEQAAQYAARYSSKPANLSKIPVAEGAELILAMHGRRICGCWGKSCKISFRPKKPEDADKWRNVGSFAIVIELLDVDPIANQIWQAWHDGCALPPDISLAPTENEIYGIFTEDAPEQPPPPTQYQLNFFD